MTHPDTQPDTQTETTPRTAAKPENPPWADPPGKLALAVLFGLAFGFLLQKGGVAKFDILIGVLLLEEFTVVKVMLSAIVVGMLGVPVLQRMGVLELHIKDTVLGSNIIGGLIFGVGFALLAYCPGTNAAALGQGNLDALAGIAGMIAGSAVFAIASAGGPDRLSKRDNLGRARLNSLVGLPDWLTAIAVSACLVAVLLLIELAVEA